MSKIVIYSLNGCGYSKSSVSILENRNVDAKIHNIEWKDKEAIKKQNNMGTFPQIYLDFNSKKYKIGGDSELKSIISLIDTTKKNGKFDDMVNKITNLVEGGKRVALEVTNILK